MIFVQHNRDAMTATRLSKGLSCNQNNMRDAKKLGVPLWNAHEQRLLRHQRAGCLRISASAFNRVESASLFAEAADVSNDEARPLSFASSLCFIFEVSALVIDTRRASI